jgi:putative transposase
VRWAMIKRFVSKKCGPLLFRKEWMTLSKRKRNESTIWQRRFWEHEIRDEKDYIIHMNYIHYNPVKHGYVSKAGDWQFSTFHRYLRNGIYTQDWGDSNITDIKGDFGE